MDFSAYVNKPFNELFVTFDESLLHSDKKELPDYFFERECLISNESHKWEKINGKYFIRLETKKMAGASMYYTKELIDYFRRKRRVVKFRVDTPQDWLMNIEEKPISIEDTKRPLEIDAGPITPTVNT